MNTLLPTAAKLIEHGLSNKDIAKRLVHLNEELESRLGYWADVTECVCDSPHPIGGCLKCDLEKLKELLL
jgi:hypothetical protein